MLASNMQFLSWLYLRLKNKYHEDNTVLHELENLIKEYRLIQKKIIPSFIDDICKKHFVDFDMDKSEDLHFGFSEQDRARYRNFVIDIIGQLQEKN